MNQIKSLWFDIKSNCEIYVNRDVSQTACPLVIVCVCVCVQAPPGLKKNLKRTYESWSAEQISKGGHLTRAQSLFCLAWFHAVCQERRNYIPQVHTGHMTADTVYTQTIAGIQTGALGSVWAINSDSELKYCASGL